MSIYYKQKFVSPQAVFAEVKEMMSSYFNSGAIDDMMFPIWTDHCLKRFKKSAHPIKEAVIPVSSYEGCLPEDFNAVREAWMCTVEWSDPIQAPTSYYYQTDCRIDPQVDSCDPCATDNPNCCDKRFLVTHKVTNKYMFSFERTFLLKPGNMNARNSCGDYCANINADTPYTFDIVNGKITTNFIEGTIHLIYYSNAMEDGEQLIPDNFFVQEYIRAYLTYKCFQKLSNEVTDETFNQIQVKLQQAKLDQSSAYVTAMNEMKKQTPEEKVRQIGVSYRRFLKRYGRL